MVDVATQYVTRNECGLKFAIRDMLIDIMHLCKYKKIDFEDRLNNAKEVYVIEQDLQKTKRIILCTENALT
jgi:hypothetical protein